MKDNATALNEIMEMIESGEGLDKINTAIMDYHSKNLKKTKVLDYAMASFENLQNMMVELGWLHQDEVLRADALIVLRNTLEEHLDELPSAEEFRNEYAKGLKMINGAMANPAAATNPAKNVGPTPLESWMHSETSAALSKQHKQTTDEFLEELKKMLD